MENFCICWNFSETGDSFHWLLKAIHDLQQQEPSPHRKISKTQYLVTTMFSLSLMKHRHMVFPLKPHDRLLSDTIQYKQPKKQNPNACALLSSNCLISLSLKRNMQHLSRLNLLCIRGNSVLLGKILQSCILKKGRKGPNLSKAQIKYISK